MKNYKIIKFTWTGKKWKEKSKLVARNTGARHEKNSRNKPQRNKKNTKYEYLVLLSPLNAVMFCKQA